MTYQVKFMPKAVDDLSRLDKVIAQRILTKVRWLSENFDNLTPEVLIGEWKGHLQGEVIEERRLPSAGK